MKKVFYIAITALLLITPAHAEIYKWVDDQGKVHYGDKPVADSKQVEVKEEASKGQKISAEERRERRQRLLDAFAEDREKKKEQKAKQAKKQAKINRQCVLARDHLKNYRKAGSLYKLDKDGNRIILSSEERRLTTERLQAQIDKYCN